MGLIFLFILIIAAIFLSQYIGAKDDKQRESAKINCIGFSMVGAVILCIILSGSYCGYVDMSKKLAVIEQYKETVTYYSKKGVAEFKTQRLAGELTDLKYNNYQQQIGEMIREMRDKIVGYNEIYTGKRVMKDGWFFGILIILPDNMKPVVMADYLK